MRWEPALLFVAACGRQGFDAIDLGDYAYRKSVSIASGYELTDFPLSVVTTDADLQSHARGDGRDIVFATDNATVLAHELVAYDGTSGSLEAWVLVPRLAAADTIWMYYGGPEGEQDAQAVWAGYAGVWHMAGTGNRENDSTPNGNTLGAVTVASQPASAIGIVGGARDYDGIANAMVTPDAASLDFGLTSFSYGVWVHVPQSAGSFDMPLFKGGSSASTSGYDIELGTNEWLACFGDGTASTCARFGGEPQFLGQWVSLVAVIDRTALEARTYVNSIQVAVASIAAYGPFDSERSLEVGSGGSLFRGRVDEVWITAGALDEPRIAAAYANVAARSSFMTIGVEQVQLARH